MDTKGLIRTGIVSTTFMTLFSYALAEYRDKKFEEPVLLGDLIHRLYPAMKKQFAQFAGWQIHYAIGILWAALYYLRWQKKRSKWAIYTSSLLWGVISGVVAAAVWRTTFRLHPNPPKTNYKRHYLQLVTAHIILTVVAAADYSNEQKNLIA